MPFSSNVELAVCTKGLDRQVCALSGHRQDAQRVGVSKTTLPALHSNNGGASLDDVQLQRIAQTEANAVVDLKTIWSAQHLRTTLARHLHRSATGGPQYPWARGSGRDSIPCGGEFDERSAGSV